MTKHRFVPRKRSRYCRSCGEEDYHPVHGYYEGGTMSEKTGAASITEAEDQRILGAMVKAASEKEQVNHPAHYNQGGPKEADGTAKYEVIKVIESWGLGFCFGNALKYILRAPHKGSEEVDLNKARWYLDRATMNGETVPPRQEGFWAEEVAKAWGLPKLLADAVHWISSGVAPRAILSLDEHVIERAAREVRERP